MFIFLSLLLLSGHFVSTIRSMESTTPPIQQNNQVLNTDPTGTLFARDVTKYTCTNSLVTSSTNQPAPMISNVPEASDLNNFTNVPNNNPLAIKTTHAILTNDSEKKIKKIKSNILSVQQFNQLNIYRSKPELIKAISETLGKLKHDSSTHALEKILTDNKTLLGINEPLDNNNNTLLHWATLRQNAQLIQYLKNNGADYTVKNKDEKTPLQLLNELTGLKSQHVREQLEKLLQ